MGSEPAEIKIVSMGAENARLYNSIPSRFELTGLVRVSARAGLFSYEFETLAPPHAYKTYPDDPYRPRGNHAVFFAMAGGACVGQVLIGEYWNGMARVEDIRVADGFRGKGAGRQLINAAMAWARAQGYPAVCLETQSNNADACRFYAACGFALKGADAGIYDSTPDRGETALYWYYPLVK